MSPSQNVNMLALVGLQISALLIGLQAMPANSPACVACDLEYFRVGSIPLDGFDAPAITNHWIWAQAANQFGTGILNMEDVRPGGQPQFHGTIDVKVNGALLAARPPVADWWPNKVVRRVTVDGVEYVGTVLAADRKYALLSRLVATNQTSEPRVVTIEIKGRVNGGLFGTLERPTAVEKDKDHWAGRFENVTIAPGRSWQVRALNLYRSDEIERDQILAEFEAEWAASNEYWNGLLTDAFTPGRGRYLTGGVPRFHTNEKDAQRLYNFGIVTLLMVLKNDPDKVGRYNWYGTSMPDASYGTSTYIWDVGYVSDVLAMMDPAALRNALEQWATAGVHEILSVPYDGSHNMSGGRFYASNGSMFFLSAWNYINYTGDYAWLEKKIVGKTMLQHLREVADWHKTRPQWNGLAHYGEEENLFDDLTVVGYHHFVAAPNAALVWVKRRLADLYERRYGDRRTAETLRKEGDGIATALIEHLYNAEAEFSGTWKQRHVDGRFLRIRHSWDFMNTGSFLAGDLTMERKQQMRDWFLGNLVRVDSDDVWVVAQDRRDGNNGDHQMEHNGRGAYPAWPFHQGWALSEMGFSQDTIDLLHVIDGIVRYGAIGQGHFPNGRRCRSGWASAAGATAATYLLDNLFDIRPGLDAFSPKPRLGNFDKDAWFENVPIRGKLYRVDRTGAVDRQ